jgi:hypothetical protein
MSGKVMIAIALALLASAETLIEFVCRLWGF